jgi:DNA modification methylase
MMRKYDIPDTIIGGNVECSHNWSDMNLCSKCNAWKGQYGLEIVPFGRSYGYVEHTILWLKEAWRVLKDDGCLFLVLDDKYAGSMMGKGCKKRTKQEMGGRYDYKSIFEYLPKDTTWGVRRKSKLCIPEDTTVRMRDMGWIIRNSIKWKRTMPESVKDRFTCQYEWIIFATKQPKYKFYLENVKEQIKNTKRLKKKVGSRKPNKYEGVSNYKCGGLNSGDSTYIKRLAEGKITGKNPGDIWLDYYLDTTKKLIEELGVDGYINVLKNQITYESDIFPPMLSFLKDKHYAPFSEKLVERLIRCSTEEGDVVLDPFCGSGTTLVVAKKLNRKFVGIDLGYKDIQAKRLA